MKKLSTFILIICAIIFFSTTVLYAQALIDVQVSSNVFTPANITINVGDTVRWTNVYGFHNVNGDSLTYPANPEYFGNVVAGPGWVFTHVFNTPGTYDYQCDPHVAYNMFGAITVQIPTSISENNISNVLIKAYPNPTKDYFIIEFENVKPENRSDLKIILYDQQGKKVYEEKNLRSNKIIVDRKEINSGVIFANLVLNQQVIYSEKIILY